MKSHCYIATREGYFVAAYFAPAPADSVGAFAAEYLALGCTIEPCADRVAYAIRREALRPLADAPPHVRLG